MRFHFRCFKCIQCGRGIADGLRDAGWQMDGGIMCGSCGGKAGNAKSLENVTQLEQYTFLLRCALRRLCMLLNVRGKYFFF